MTTPQRATHTSLTPRRRTVVKAAAATAVLAGPLAAALPARAASETTPAFLHGLASGDPLADGVLLWTRVTPTAEALPGSGLGPDTEVEWVIARDKALTDIAARGTVTATAASDHTVKADVRGLAPATDYWFRFSAGTTLSPVARTRTAPAADASVAGLRFGVVSCANWEAGYFASYRHLAARNDLDAWLHLGDYIYEYGTGQYGTRGKVIRPHVPTHEIITLADYRARHGNYKTDGDLQALHAKAPVVAIWDDHEFANDSWSGGAENHTEGAEGTWTARQAAAKQAYFEWMPVRPALAGTTYRRLRFGKLADLSLLDLRSFRSQQVKTGNGSVDDPERTITGRAQLDWLKAGLKSSDTTWKLVGNSVMISPFAIGSLAADIFKPLAKLLGLPEEGIALNTDQWDGYTDDRRELLAHLRSNAISNTVFLTGDIHMAWANDVPVDAGTYPLSPSAATEFVVTSITSDNLDDLTNAPEGVISALASPVIRAANRHVQWIDTDRHGYGVLDITPARAQMDYYTLSDKTKQNATSSWSRSYRTLAGTQKVERTYDPV
ncbi:alkaline phosphatase D family protein [Streptomyces acidiscabies]|uniref:Alkaline phosphatase D family protein n=3 Tax=Streptomyces acidiscabies TaxID=42234 RepID=A0AAP6EDG6_9ACTN|nr:alkaline phosphatase D family protein [Streptomyces acidiscabies]MBP5940225.1 alkaline phosphatase [Streptomyces sp. LBUM 1476]MBZ3911445.1 alkaline phosphatase D family protein [Streptomyces acidiscabies]MDX2958669.1 alkaline phosphatase D family protein [Streptomyces acidiscabies]MDX3018107.1 alkaline phosphatase D family protein [Streptomyces acidiscabies]MDX3791504.1 alkaline phosphatase D family protein [Streptomyces acidiscabies]